MAEGIKKWKLQPGDIITIDPSYTGQTSYQYKKGFSAEMKKRAQEFDRRVRNLTAKTTYDYLLDE